MSKPPGNDEWRAAFAAIFDIAVVVFILSALILLFID